MSDGNQSKIVQAGSQGIYRPEEITLLNIHEWRGAFGTAIRIFDGLYKGGFRANIRYSIAIALGEDLGEVRQLLYLAPSKYTYEVNGVRIFELKEKGVLVGHVVYVVLPL